MEAPNGLSGELNGWEVISGGWEVAVSSPQDTTELESNREVPLNSRANGDVGEPEASATVDSGTTCLPATTLGTTISEIQEPPDMAEGKAVEVLSSTLNGVALAFTHCSREDPPKGAGPTDNKAISTELMPNMMCPLGLVERAARNERETDGCPELSSRRESPKSESPRPDDATVKVLGHPSQGVAVPAEGSSRGFPFTPNNMCTGKLLGLPSVQSMPEICSPLGERNRNCSLPGGLGDLCRDPVPLPHCPPGNVSEPSVKPPAATTTGHDEEGSLPAESTTGDFWMAATPVATSTALPDSLSGEPSTTVPMTGRMSPGSPSLQRPATVQEEYENPSFAGLKLTSMAAPDLMAGTLKAPGMRSLGTPCGAPAATSSIAFVSPSGALNVSVMGTGPFSVFGSPAATSPPAPSLPFGAPAATITPAPGLPFGASTASSTKTEGALFGAPVATSTPAPGLPFGASTASSTRTAGALFGAPVATSTPAPGLPFGASTASSTRTAGGMFGASAAKSTPAPGLPFGAPVATSTPAPGLPFGASTASSTRTAGGMFGASAAKSTPARDLLFGAPVATSTPAPRLPFGASTASSTRTEGGMFGASAAKSTPARDLLFGAPAATSTSAPCLPFGAPAATSPTTTPAHGPLFGASTASSTKTEGALFGAPAATSIPAIGLPFGAPVATSTPAPGLPFGASTASSTRTEGGMFGAYAAKSTPARDLPFGAPAATSTPAPCLPFGAPAATTTPAHGPLFGASTASNTKTEGALFGAPAATSIPAIGLPFKAPVATSTPAPGLPFGAPVATSTPPPGLPFGASTASSTTTAGGLFGAPAATSTPAPGYLSAGLEVSCAGTPGTLFGALNSTGTGTARPTFGAPAAWSSERTNTRTEGNLFCGSSCSNGSSSSGCATGTSALFGVPTATRSSFYHLKPADEAPYQKTYCINFGYLNSISAMDQHQGWSVEEMRWKQYEMTAMSTPAPGLLFGASDSSSKQTEGALFGAPAATNIPAPGLLFGAPAAASILAPPITVVPRSQQPVSAPGVINIYMSSNSQLFVCFGYPFTDVMSQGSNTS